MCTVRKARLPDDKPVILEFIMALQRYESFMEPNRRYDRAMAEEYCAVLLDRARRGLIFIAEDERARPIGWSIVYEEETEAFICAEERRFAYLAELFVTEAQRGSGAAYALIAACEDWARASGYATIRIDLLARNERAARAYAKAGYAPYCQEVRKRLIPAQGEAAVIEFESTRKQRPPLAAAE
jgi:GNAT superfamily N-acetyltransferase